MYKNVLPMIRQHTYISITPINKQKGTTKQLTQTNIQAENSWSQDAPANDWGTESKAQNESRKQRQHPVLVLSQHVLSSRQIHFTKTPRFSISGKENRVKTVISLFIKLLSIRLPM